MIQLPLRRLCACFMVLLFAAMPARAEWRRAESPNFVIYSQESESRLRDRVVSLESFDRLLRMMTTISQPPAPNKLTIYVVDGPSDLRIIRPVAAGVAGFYTATPYGIAAFVDGNLSSSEILFHEYAHHFMMQYAPNAYPAWYVEGFAEYFMTVQLRDRSIDIGRHSEGRGYALVEGQWLPIERVLFGDLNGLDREQRAQFYAQSWLLTHFFYSSPERQAALGRYLVAGRQGDRGAALETATGMGPEALAQELRRYIRGGRINYRRLTPENPQAPPPITVASMPASADDLMLYEAALRIGVRDEDQQSYLGRIRSAVARYRDDALAKRVLAHAELLFGNRGAAEALLRAQLAASPGDAELMYLMGMLHLTAAEKGDEWEREARSARTWFTRAHRANENHFQTLYRFAQSMRGEPGYVSENTSNVLLLAHQLAPQVPEVTMNAAMMLISRGEADYAEALLRPLAADPHNEGLAQAAQRLMLQARQVARPAAQNAGPAGEN